MIEKGRKKGTVRFGFKPRGEAKQVRLLGDFTDWQPLTMRKQKSGSYTVILPLKAGTYEYRFVVDGEWVGDSDNHFWSPNPYGSMNSVARIAW